MRGAGSDFQCGSIQSDSVEDEMPENDEGPGQCRPSMMRQQSIRDKKGSRPRKAIDSMTTP